MSCSDVILIQLILIHICASSKGIKYVPDACKADEYLTDVISKRKFLNCECVGQNDPLRSFKEFVVIKLMSKDQKKVSKYCGGSVINDLLILTTMSCVIEESELNVLDHVLRRKEMDHSRITVYSRVTKNDSLSETAVLKVHSIVCHPYAFPLVILNGVADYDVCLIRLQNRLKLEGDNRMPTVCLLSSVSSSEDIVYSEATGINFVVKAEESNKTNRMIEFSTTQGKVLSPGDCEVTSDRMNCFQNDNNDRLTPGSPIMGVDKSGFLALIGTVSNISVQVDSEKFQYCNMYKVFTSLASKEIQDFINTESSLANAHWCKYTRSSIKLKRVAEETLSLTPSTRKYCWDQLPRSLFVQKISSCKCGVPKSFPRQRIVGGTPATPHEYQWPAQLFITKENSANQKETEGCGGTVINSKFILTAAHCVAGLNCKYVIAPSDIVVKLKKYSGFKRNKGTEGVPVKVAKVYCHPDFSQEKIEVDGQKFQSLRSDIALLELEDHISFDDVNEIRPICLQDTNTPENMLLNKSANVIGWGYVNQSNPDSLSTTLQELQVTIVDRKVCEATLKGLGFQFPDKVICAGNFKTFEGYQDPFHGDSGGPLMLQVPFVSHEDKFFLAQVGIVSGGSFSITNKPKPTDIPVVWYTHVAEYLPFIEYLSNQAEALWCTKP